MGDPHRPAAGRHAHTTLRIAGRSPTDRSADTVIRAKWPADTRMLCAAELTGVHSARRGAFRISYEIDDVIRLVTALRVEHRADVYRPR